MSGTVIAVKGFDKDLKCRGYQFAVGETFTQHGDIVVCDNGFHACENPLDVLTFYPPCTSRFCEVEMSGAIERETKNSKIAAASITIKAELKLPDIIRLAASWIIGLATGNTATGDSGHAAATGHSGHAAATGRFGHAAATGDSGHAAATGHSGHAAATGDFGHAAATGDSGIAVAVGRFGAAKAGPKGWITLSAYDPCGELVLVKSVKVGAEGVKPDTFYLLNVDGSLAEVAE